MALTNIVLLRYNNYYNRIKKKKDTLTEYMNLGNNAVYTDVNFYKGDGIETQLLLNNGNLLHGPTQSTLNVDDADYLIEYGTGSSIVSRWFIMEALQTRNNQYRLSLKRDVIADHWDSVLDATSYIEKATISSNDVAIYNREGADFNLIKTEETLLKDKTKVPWIVGFYAPNIDQDKSFSSGGSSINAIRVYSKETWEYHHYIGNDYKYVNDSDYESFDIKIWTTALTILNQAANQRMRVSLNGSTIRMNGEFNYPIGYKGNYVSLENWIHDNKEEILSRFFQYSSLKRTDITGYDGKYLYETSTGKYYKISINDNGSVTESVDYSVSDNISTNINNFILTSESAYTPAYSLYAPNISSTATYKKLRIALNEEDIGLNLASKISKTSNLLSDAPYKMFAIPYGSISIRVSTASQGYIYSIGRAEVNALVNSIVTTLGSNLYDIQLLPYCPMPERIEEGDGWIMDASDSLGNEKDFDYIKSGESFKGVIFYPKNSTFTFDIAKSIELSGDAVDVKIENQCTSYRLCSPNQSAIFEFNLAKTGSISVFNVDCTYKPFSPYIHVNPVWGNLYGRDYNDTRGLIVQGDFSIPVMRDQWIEYQLNNKNYLNSFNRQVESIELQNKYAKTSDILNAITGTAQGGITGAMAGSVGGIPGAIAGGIVGTGAAGVGGALDISINEKLRNESLDLSRDQFNYSLRNIQALPNTLAKVSSYDANNKMFIVLEKYTCTDQEKEIFRNTLKYEGMTVMKIGKIRDYILNDQSYIKARMIRIDLAGDNHMVMNIAAEMNGGMYI